MIERQGLEDSKPPGWLAGSWYYKGKHINDRTAGIGRLQASWMVGKVLVLASYKQSDNIKGT